MMGLNKLGAIVMVIIAVRLTAIVIIYLLWWRPQRYRPQGRIEPHEASLPYSSTSLGGRECELEQQVMKFQHMYGPSRILFTIKEEEREDLESENGGSYAECSAVVVKKLVAADEVAVAMDELLEEATTPFTTPCASPPYYTPYSSPSREAYKDNTTEMDELQHCERDETSFYSPLTPLNHRHQGTKDSVRVLVK